MTVNYDEIIQLITNSDAKEDWAEVNFGNHAKYIYRKDVRIWIVNERPSEEPEAFGESWATNCADNRAYTKFHQIYFNSSLLAEIMLISIDGGRAVLPLPKMENRPQYTEPRELDLKIAQIVDSGQLEKYLKQRYSQNFSV